MKKLTGLRKPLVNLDGEPLREIYREDADGKPVEREVTFVTLLAQRIYTSTRKTDTMLLRKIAQDLYAGGDEQTFPDEELAVIKAVLEADDTFFAFSRAHCLEILNGATEVVSKAASPLD